MANGTIAVSQLEILTQSGTGIITVVPPATNTNRTLTLPDATGTVVASGTTPSLNGIAFPATQVPSADANTLDDYEEGSWTPSFTFASGGPATTVGNTGGRYVKVGKQVTCWFFINCSSLNGGSGQVYLSGLPFANANVASGAEGATMTPNFWGSWASSVIPSGYVMQNQAKVLMMNTVPASNAALMSASAMTSTSNLYANFTYFTD